MREPIACQRHLFDLPDGVVYLNCAYMSPILKRAAEVGAEAIGSRRNAAARSSPAAQPAGG